MTEQDLIERFGLLGVALAAIGFIGRWFIKAYEDKEQRLMSILDAREEEIRRLVALQEEKERLYREDIQRLSDKFLEGLERISGHIDRMTSTLESLSTDVRVLKDAVFNGRRRKSAPADQD